jgi:hypothetical protein
MREWKCKDLGPAKGFVGFQIDRDRTNRTLKLRQTIYTNKLLERLKMNNCNPIRLLIPAGTVLKPDTQNPLEYNEATVYWRRRHLATSLWLYFSGPRRHLCQPAACIKPAMLQKILESSGNYRPL